MKLVADNPKLLSTIKVRFRGNAYWLLSELRPGLGRALAYPEHCDHTGEVSLRFGWNESFAHLCSDGVIRRYRKDIGVAEDLEVLLD